MINFYKNDDHGFAFWLKNNPVGYVYDDFSGPNPSHRKLHTSNCRQLRSPGASSAGPGIRKVCCPDLNELVYWIDKNVGPESEGYFPCSHCHPFHTRENNIWN
jgi:hypothetical protein